MRLTLDWDDLDARQSNLSDVQARRTLEGPNPWQLRQSSGGDGFHYVEWDAASTWEASLQLRSEHGDDPKRVRMDMIRRARGSPFLQVLYDTKYMSRWGWQPETGNQVQVLDGTKYVPEEQRIKRDGLLDYNKIARLLAADVYGSQAALAESLGVAGSTVSGWVRGEHGPSSGLQKKLRRRARSHGLGHFDPDADKSSERMGLEVAYVDPSEKEARRTIVEYLSVPWADDDETLKGNLDDDEESTERTLNVHTGTFNPNHSDGQLKGIHDDVEAHVRDVLSPDNRGTNLPSLSLDRRNNNAITREEDSVNFENALLDPDEARFYRANMAGNTAAGSKGLTVDDLARFPLFEVVLWDDEMVNIEWLVLGVWTGSTVGEATIVADSRGWW